MLQTSITHYVPWDEDGARCGVPVLDVTHSLAPTCPVCATSLAVLEDVPVDEEVCA